MRLPDALFWKVRNWLGTVDFRRGRKPHNTVFEVVLFSVDI